MDDAIIHVKVTDGIQIAERTNVDSVNFTNHAIAPHAMNHSML
jgi:hypothetical protein